MQGARQRGPIRPNRREPVEVVEPQRADRMLAQVRAIRKQRLDRLERAFVQSRQQLVEAKQRFALSGEALRVREAAADSYWQELRQCFHTMVISSAEFVRGRKHYEALREEANLARSDVTRALVHWKAEARSVRAQRELLREARRGVEKLDQYAQESEAV